MRTDEPTQPIYAHDTMEFTTVAVQFCGYLESQEARDKREFIDTILKMLPLMYLKAQMLPRVESEGDFLPADQVTESDYEWVKNNVYSVMAADDEFLDIAPDDATRTDETQWRSVSELLADVYQPVRNFLAVYQNGVETCMFDALWALSDNFEQYWGQALVDAMRQLHKVRYSMSNNDDDDEY